MEGQISHCGYSILEFLTESHDPHGVEGVDQRYAPAIKTASTK